MDSELQFVQPGEVLGTIYNVDSGVPTELPTTNEQPTATFTPVAGAFGPLNFLMSPSFAEQDTDTTNSMGPDGYTFAYAKPIITDQYGKIFIWGEKDGGSYRPIISNDSGSTWIEPTISGFLNGSGEGAVTRASTAYDSVNDLFHVCWNCTNASDGIIYRRYAPTRDGSHNITAFTRVSGVNLQLDLESTGTMVYNHPNLLWIPEGGVNGSVLCAWGARNSAGVSNKTELRASMRVLSNTTADNTAGNWVAPVTVGTTDIGNAPAVAYSIIATGNFSACNHPAIYRKRSGTHALDVYAAYFDGNAAWKYRRLQWDAGDNDWSGGLSTETTLSLLKISGTDTGYSLKYELMSQISEDTVNDRLYVAFPIWIGNASGDTVSVVNIASDDSVSSRTNIYSAGGAHSYAPCVDAIYDNTAKRLVVIYQKTSSQDFWFQTYINGTALDQDETAVYTGTILDVPLIYDGRIGNKLFVMFRDAVNTPTPPYTGFAGTIVWGRN